MTEKKSTNRCGCVILASGTAKRFGSNKLLQQFQGKPLISYIMDIAASEDFSSVIVVTRWREVAELAGKAHLPVLLHSLPSVSDTIRLGTQYITGNMAGIPAPSGIMYCVADQPLLSKTTVRTMLQLFAAYSDSIIRLEGTDQETGKQRFANPVIFPVSLAPELTALAPDQTGRCVIAAHSDLVRTVTVSNGAELMDADTVGQLYKLEQIADNQDQAG